MTPYLVRAQEQFLLNQIISNVCDHGQSDYAALVGLHHHPDVHHEITECQATGNQMCDCSEQAKNRYDTKDESANEKHDAGGDIGAG